jgi:hypothetical protein
MGNWRRDEPAWASEVEQGLDRSTAPRAAAVSFPLIVLGNIW